jgi:Spy/CpxP family protein refolding chaperone
MATEGFFSAGRHKKRANSMTTKSCAGSFFFAAISSASILFAADSKTDHSADGKPAASTANAPADAAADATTNTIPDNVQIKGRLPSGWGKLGLTDLQRQAVYKVQAAYNSQISTLEAKRDAEMRKVLTTAQQNLLAEQAEAKAAAKSKKKEVVADDKTDPSTATTTTKKSKTSTKSSSSPDSAAAVAETK